MQYIKAVYVDAKDGIPVTVAPLRNGPKLPHDLLVVTVVDRSDPTKPATILGKLPDGENLNDGMEKITKTKHDQLVADYNAWWNKRQEDLLLERRQRMVISKFQARSIIRQYGLLDQVEALVSNPEADVTLVDAWNHAQEFRRLSPTLSGVCQLLGLTDEQIDTMFDEAAQIEA